MLSVWPTNMNYSRLLILVIIASKKLAAKLSTKSAMSKNSSWTTMISAFQVRQKVLIISYLLLWPAFIWQFFWKEKSGWLPSKNKVADENVYFQRHTNFLVKLQCSVFSSATFFRSQLEITSPKKNSSNESRSK